MKNPVLPSTILSIRIPVVMKEQLESLAEATSRNKSYLAAKAIENYLDLHLWQVEGIKEALAEADNGKLVDHDDVVKWLNSWDTDNEKEPPRCKSSGQEKQ